MVTWILILVILALFWSLGALNMQLKEVEVERNVWRETARKVFLSHCTTLRTIWKVAAPDKDCPGCDTTGVILNSEGVSACPVCNGDPTTT